jgi:hypothetical protein
MIERCHNPSHVNFEGYGGRGIKVCDRWRAAFLNFLADVGDRPSARHSIDRFPNNDGNYEPGNVRWATRRQQARNKRTSKLDEKNITDIRASVSPQYVIAAAYGVSPSLISRIKSGEIWR